MIFYFNKNVWVSIGRGHVIKGAASIYFLYLHHRHSEVHPHVCRKLKG
jgi:hypothetical protein